MSHWKPITKQQKKEIIWCKGSWNYSSAKVTLITTLLMVGFLLVSLIRGFVTSGSTFHEFFAPSEHDIVVLVILFAGLFVMCAVLIFIQYGFQVILRAIQVHRYTVYYQYATFVSTDMNKWGIIEVNAKLEGGGMIHGDLNFATSKYIRDAKKLIAYYYDEKGSVHFGILK